MQPSVGTKRRRWSAVAVAASILTASVACDGPQTSAPSPQTTPATSWRELASATASSLACVQTTFLDADPYFYDEMQGFNCDLDDGSTVVFRAYRNPDSVGQVLDEWRPVLTTDRPATWGHQWFAIGPLHEMETLAGLIDDAVGPSIDTPPPAPMTREADEMTTCVRLTTSAMADFASDRAAFDRDSPHLEVIYPGLNRLVTDEVTPSRAVVLSGLDGQDALAFQAALAESGGAVRRFCARHP